MSLDTQKITRTLEAAAQEALGGPAARPPQPLPMGDVSGRAAFEAHHAAAQAAAGPPAPLGNPTFDAAPSELLARRAKVGIVRDRLGNLARLILSEHAALTPLLTDLADDQMILAESEAFDTAAAQSFIGSLNAIVASLSKPAKPAKK